jgi:hypothetical protein
MLERADGRAHQKSGQFQIFGVRFKKPILVGFGLDRSVMGTVFLVLIMNTDRRIVFHGSYIEDQSPRDYRLTIFVVTHPV